MRYSIAPLTVAVMLTGVAVPGQESVCDLFKDLEAADGRRIIVSGELIVGKDLMAIGASDCDNRYQSSIEGSGIRISRMWPTALRLRPSSTVPPAKMKQLRDASVRVNRLRSAGKAVSASASFSGRIRLGEAGDLPGELTFDSVDDLKVEALPDAGELPVIPICELFQDLPAWKGQRIAVRGESVGTSEGSWIVGRCKGAFITNGYRWPVSLSHAGPAYYSDSTAKIAEVKQPSVRPKGWEQFRGRNNVVKTETYIGRLRMRKETTAICRGGDYLTFGFGHMGWAAAELDVEEIRDVELTKPPPDVEPEAEQGCQLPNISALCSAAAQLSQAAGLGCTGHVLELLSRDGIDSKDGGESDALTAAIRTGNQAMVKILLDAGAPVNPLKFSIWPPLGEAAGQRNIELMKMLLKAGANVDAVDDHGATYLAAYGYFDTRVLRTLLEAGANPNAGDSSHGTALMQASGYGYEDAVLLLLEHGAEVNLKDDKGRTALMYAAGGKYVDAIPPLLAKGADVHARDADGKTALDLAHASGNEVAVELLSAAAAGNR